MKTSKRIRSKNTRNKKKAQLFSFPPKRRDFIQKQMDKYSPDQLRWIANELETRVLLIRQHLTKFYSHNQAGTGN